MKRIIILTFFIMICQASAAFGYSTPKEPAQSGMTAAELNGYSEEEWGRLCDDTLEYSEIGELIHLFNPSIKSGWDMMEDSAQELRRSVDIMDEAEKISVQNYKDILKQSREYPGSVPQSTIDGLKALADSTGSTRYSLTSRLDALGRNSTYNSQLRSAEKQLTAAVRSLAIGYETVAANREILSELEELYKESYDAALAMRTVGMATDNDVLSAYANMLSAGNNARSLEAQEKQLYQQLITLCGWKSTDNVTVKGPGEPDLNRIASYDPAADIDKAIGSNSSLISYRSASKDGSQAGRNAYQASEKEMEDNLRINLDALYRNVTAALQGYESALENLQASETVKKGADIQYETGMINKAQYLGSTIACVQAKAGYRGAALSLIQAMNTYEQALEGNASVE